MAKAIVKYTTADGREHVEAIDLTCNPILSVEALYVDGVLVPPENISLIEEP